MPNHADRKTWVGGRAVGCVLPVHCAGLHGLTGVLETAFQRQWPSLKTQRMQERPFAEALCLWH